MAYAVNLNSLIVAVFFGGLGLALGSGSFEALIYDSLKEGGKIEKFDKVISNITTLKLAATAIAGSIGGFLYVANPKYPFLGAGLIYFGGFLLTFLLKEPVVDTEKFSLRVFVEQNRQGFVKLKELFRKEQLAVFILVVSAIWVISDEMLENILSVEIGYKAKYIGIFISIVFVISALASQLTPIIKRKFGDRKGLLVSSAIMSVAYMLSPISGILLGSATIAIRDASSRVFQNFSTIIFNKHIESRYRATVLSTYNMFKNLPYVVSAYLLGSLMKAITAKNFAFILGLIIAIAAVLKLKAIINKPSTSASFENQ